MFIFHNNFPPLITEHYSKGLTLRQVKSECSKLLLNSLQGVRKMYLLISKIAEIKITEMNAVF
jgi:hypothetical protein